MFASLRPLTNFLSTQGRKASYLDDGKIESTCLLKLCTFHLCIFTRTSTENIPTASHSSETNHHFVCKKWKKLPAIIGKCACNPRFLYRLSLQCSGPRSALLYMSLVNVSYRILQHCGGNITRKPVTLNSVNPCSLVWYMHQSSPAG